MRTTARLLWVVGVTATAAAIFTAPACASEEIESFSSTLSSSLVGGHPDIETTFRLAEPGVEEAARNVAFEAPEGVFGNPRAIDQCTSLDFAFDPVPSFEPGRTDHYPCQLRRRPGSSPGDRSPL